jgi:ABC-type phosphate/phosphonate transport system ATPase subunit
MDKALRTSLAGNILGSARAENDKTMLENAFIGTADYHALTQTNDFNFVVGRRGTGKSALFLKIAQHFQSDKSVLLYEEKPKEYEALEYQSILASYAKDYPSIRSITRIIWRATILLSILYTVSNHYKFHKCDDYKYLSGYKLKHLKLEKLSIFQKSIEIMNYLAASCEVSPPGRKTLRSKLRGIYPARNKIFFRQDKRP